MFYKEDGEWKHKKAPRSFNKIYLEALTEYLNCLDPLFLKAKDSSEFEFILALLDIKGFQDAGWDSSETTQDIFRTFSGLKRKIKYNDDQTYLFLLLYGLIIEASFIYDLLANLLNIIGGDRYKIINFPDKKRGNYTLPQTPSEKIIKLNNLANNLKVPDAIKPIKDIYDRNLRNAVFHSDYALYNEEVRLLSNNNKKYPLKEINTIINKTLAYFESIVFLKKYYKNSYTESKLIAVSPDFSHDPEEQAVVMIREGTGVIGLKDNWTKEQLEKGKIPFSLSKLLPYEALMFKNDPFLKTFPPSRIDRANKILKKLPLFLRKRLFKTMNKIFKL